MRALRARRVGSGVGRGAVATLLASALWACGAPAPVDTAAGASGLARPGGGEAMGCDVNVSASDALTAALGEAADGATVCLAAGIYEGPFPVKGGVTLRAADGVAAADVVLDGGGAQVVKVAPGAKVTLERLTLRNGRAELGGALQIMGGAEVTLTACVLDGLSASAKGGAVFVEEGSLVASRTIFRGGNAPIGGAVAVEGDASARFEGCLFVGNQSARGAAVSAHDAAQVAIVGTSFVDNAGDGADLNVRGSMSQTPAVTVLGGLFTGGIAERPPGAVSVSHSAFDEGAMGFPDEGEGNVQGALKLDADGRPGAGSVAKGVGGVTGPTLDGAERSARGAAGAYE